MSIRDIVDHERELRRLDKVWDDIGKEIEYRENMKNLLWKNFETKKTVLDNTYAENRNKWNQIKKQRLIVEQKKRCKVCNELMWSTNYDICPMCSPFYVENQRTIYNRNHYRKNNVAKKSKYYNMELDTDAEIIKKTLEDVAEFKKFIEEG